MSHGPRAGAGSSTHLRRSVPGRRDGGPPQTRHSNQLTASGAQRAARQLEQLPLGSAYGSVAVKIFAKLRLEPLKQFVHGYLGVGQIVFEALHALFEGRRAGTLVGNLALLYEIPE